MTASCRSRQAGATSEIAPILTAVVAGLVGCAISMSLGEYVSVSSQRDGQRALIAKEARELRELPSEELAGLYPQKGLSRSTARLVAAELTAHDPLAAHLDAELGIRAKDVASPWQAESASAVAFAIGAVLPFLAILLPPTFARIPLTFAAVLVALALTGVISARIGEEPWPRPSVRIVVGGALA